MSEIETYYSSLSEVKWFSCYIIKGEIPNTWQINVSNRGNHADWQASVSENKPSYEVPFLLPVKQVAFLALN
jgi:hypothetical protein